MVLEEVQHPGLEVAEELPVPGQCPGGEPVAGDGADGVVQAGLVVEEVEAHLIDIHPVLFLLIDLGDEDDVREFQLDLRDEPLHEGRGHQLHHVAAEAVHALEGPVMDDVVHLVPGPGVEVAVVDLDGLVPVVDARRRGEAVAGGLGRKLEIAGAVVGFRQAQGLAGIVEEVVLGRPVHGGVVVRAEGMDARDMAPVIPRHMVRDEVHDDLHPVPMGAFHQLKEFFHPGIGIRCQIRIYVVVIRDGIGRTGLPFHDLGMGRPAAFVLLPRGVADEARVPDVIDAESPDVLQGRGVDTFKLSAPPQAGKHLVKDLFQTTSSGSS